MINRISPFILEILLGFVLAVLIKIYIPETEIDNFFINNSDNLKKIYMAFISLNIAFTGYLFQEKEKDFILFLREENADKWYMNAVFFNLVILVIGIVIILFFSNLIETGINHMFLYSILGVNIVQFCTSFILWYNYIDLKRTFHSKRG
jgi:hypothetical protein